MHMLESSRLLDIRAHLAANALEPDSSPQPEWLPMRLVYLTNKLELPLDQLISAASDHTDLNRVVDRWLYWLLSVELKQYKTSAPVAELYRRRLAGDEPKKKEWKKARFDAAYAYADAAYAAAAYAAAYACAAAASAAAYDAAAYDAYATDAARKCFYERARQALLTSAREG